MTASTPDTRVLPSAQVRCKQHPRALAGWRCQSCDTALCPECAVGRRAQTVELVACGLCGGMAPPILVHRSHVPLARRLLKAWRYPFHESGIQVMVAVSIMLAVLLWMVEMSFLVIKVLPLLLYLGIFWSTFFYSLQASARGDRELDTPDLGDIHRDIIVPGVRGTLTFFVVCAPLLLYILFRRPGDVRVSTGLIDWVTRYRVSDGLLGDPVVWVLAVLALLWLPMAMLITATGKPLSSLLNVVGSANMAWRMGRDYLLTVGVLVVLGLLHLVARWLAAVISTMNMLLVSGVLAEMVTLVIPLIAAHVLGLLLYVRGDQVEYGVPTDYLEPVLGNTPPRSAAPPMRDAAPGLEASADAPELPGDGAPPVDESLSALATAVEARDVPQAMALYATLRQLPSVRVPAEHHLFIGQAAAVEGNFPLAVQALESAADVAPDEATAPRALVLLARVLGERMHDVARAEEVYRYVLHRYPDTSAARFARERVTPTSD